MTANKFRALSFVLVYTAIGVAMVMLAACAGRMVLLKNDDGVLVRCETGKSYSGFERMLDNRSLKECVDGYIAAGYREVSK